VTRTLAALLAATALITGCTQQQADKQVTVLAAASLTESFRTIAREYERAHPGVTVRLVFGASSTLARQAAAGAPGDVLATASTSTISGVKGVGRPVVFAHNRLAIATPPSNPGKVRGIADLARPDLRIAVCAQQVPCGDAAQRAFAAAHITGRPDTYEQDVKAVLTKVELGEVDAGVVYRTDVRAAGARVRGIPVNPPIFTSYPILALRSAGKDFVQFVLSAKGRAVLAAAGFDPP
jgi:molybdate transport system substrate-binding protein